MVIYVGDARNVINRIATNHCSGNVEGSAFRRHVAQAMGYKIKTSRRPSGSTKVRIDLPNPREGEDRVSNYIRSGKWKYVICNSYQEAHDFQWYAIEQLAPILNRSYRPWGRNNLQRYQVLLAQLTDFAVVSCTQLRGCNLALVFMLYIINKYLRIHRYPKR